MRKIIIYTIIILIYGIGYSQPISLSDIESGIKDNDALIEKLLGKEWIFIGKKIETHWADAFPKEYNYLKDSKSPNHIMTQTGFVSDRSFAMVITLIENSPNLLPYIGIDLEIDEDLKIIYEYIERHIKINYEKTNFYYKEKLWLTDKGGYITEYKRKFNSMEGGFEGISVHTYKVFNSTTGKMKYYLIFQPYK